MFFLILEIKELEFFFGDKDLNLINFNVVVLDLVLWVYFYCLFLKFVNILRIIVYNEFINVIVLDFELL